MTPDELRQRQAPVKARYKDDPAAARHRFHARGTLLPDRPSVHIETAFARYDAGLHEKAGGERQRHPVRDGHGEKIAGCGKCHQRWKQQETDDVEDHVLIPRERDSRFRAWPAI